MDSVARLGHRTVHSNTIAWKVRYALRPNALYTARAASHTNMYNPSHRGKRHLAGCGGWKSVCAPRDKITFRSYCTRTHVEVGWLRLHTIGQDLQSTKGRWRQSTIPHRLERVCNLRSSTAVLMSSRDLNSCKDSFILLCCINIPSLNILVHIIM